LEEPAAFMFKIKKKNHSEDGGKRLIRNVVTYLPRYTTSQKTVIFKKTVVPYLL
jgi:hypothetical protein